MTYAFLKASHPLRERVLRARVDTFIRTKVPVSGSKTRFERMLDRKSVV
jgi:hypothetical protein